MRNSKLVLITCFLALTGIAFAQAGVGINATKTVADPRAMLDIKTTSQGIRIPRLSATQMATLAGKMNTVQTGMEVSDSATGALFYWTGSQWQPISHYQGKAPLKVSETNTIALNAGTNAGDLVTWDGNNWISAQPVSHFSINFENRQPSLTLSYCIALVGYFPSRNEPFIGELEIFSFNFPPKGYAFCNGQLLPINQNQALFSLLGTYYGGNGTTNFALPDLRGRVPIHQGSGPGLSNYTQGQKGGTEAANISQ